MPTAKEQKMGLYSVLPGKDAIFFRVASAARNYGKTPNMATATGRALGVSSGARFAFGDWLLAFAFGFLNVFVEKYQLYFYERASAL